MKYKLFLCGITAIILMVLLAACNGSSGDPATVIEDYIQALSDRDSTKISNLSCADWEQNALTEIDSLTAVGSIVENLSCTQSGQDGDDVLISCTGALVLDYNGEAQQIDLSSRTYVARKEAGEWRMCGYQQ